jgi:hypothetical protein
LTHQGTTAARRAKYGEILLDGASYPVLGGGVGVEDLARFDRKFTIGDYTRDSDDLISSVIYGDFTGGFGKLHRAVVGADDNRYWTGDLDVREPFTMALPRANATESTGFSGAHWPMGDLTVSATVRFYLSANKNVMLWDESTDAFTDTVINLAFHPVNLGIEFATTLGGSPVLWVPYGADGYATWDGTTLTEFTDVKPVAFAEWDDRLWSLGSDGVLAFWDPSLGSWDTTMGQLDLRHTPKNLLVYQDVVGEPQLWAVTNRGVFGYDPVALVFQPHNFAAGLPRHPHNGKASTVWFRTGGLYYAAGLQAHQITVGATISSMGPNRDEGMPETEGGNGRIASMAAGFDEATSS